MTQAEMNAIFNRAQDGVSKHSGLTKTEVQNASAQIPDVKYYFDLVAQGLTILDPLIYTDQERARDALAAQGLDIGKTNAATQYQIANSANPHATAGAVAGAGALTTILIVAGVAGVGFLIWAASRKK